jgi:hypothetical protein
MGGVEEGHEGVVGGVVDDAVDVGLVGTCVVWVAGYDFTGCKDRGGGLEGGPEGSAYVFCCVDAEAVDWSCG